MRLITLILCLVALGADPPVRPVPAWTGQTDAPTRKSIECPPVYVSLDESPQAAMVHVWYDRPWHASINPDVELTGSHFAKLQRLEAVRSRLMPNVIVADWQQWDRRAEHRMPTFTRCRYRLGRYGEWEDFPAACWRYPHLSMLWLDYVRRRWGIEERIEEWRDACHRVEEASADQYFERHEVRRYWYWQAGNEYPRVRKLAAGYWPDLPSMPVVAYRPHPRQLIQDPLEGWR